MNEEETDSLRELVEQIDAHVEVIGTEATSNPHTNNQSGENARYQPPVPEHQPSEMATETQPVDLTVWSPNLFYAILLYSSNPSSSFSLKLICLRRRVVATEQFLISAFYLLVIRS